MRIDAHAGIGELGHVGAAERHETGPLHGGHGVAVGVCLVLPGKENGTRRRHFAGNVEEILDGEWNAGKR